MRPAGGVTRLLLLHLAAGHLEVPIDEGVHLRAAALDLQDDSTILFSALILADQK